MQETINFKSIPYANGRSEKSFNIIQMLRHGPYRYLIQMSYDGSLVCPAPLIQRQVEESLSIYIAAIQDRMDELLSDTIWPLCGIALLDRRSRAQGSINVFIAIKDHEFFQDLGPDADIIFRGIVKEAWRMTLLEINDPWLKETWGPHLAQTTMVTDQIEEILLGGAITRQSLRSIGREGLY